MSGAQRGQVGRPQSAAAAQTPRERVIREIYPLWNAGRVAEAMERFWHPDAVLFHPPGWPEPGPSIGREAVAEQFERVREDFDVDRRRHESRVGTSDWGVDDDVCGHEKALQAAAHTPADADDRKAAACGPSAGRLPVPASWCGAGRRRRQEDHERRGMRQRDCQPGAPTHAPGLTRLDHRNPRLAAIATA